MSKICTNCNNAFDDSMNICPYCGAQFGVNSAQPAQSYQQNAYPVQGYQQTYYGQPVQYPVYPNNQEQMTIGNWLATIILTNLFFPLDIIMLFVWGFGSSVPSAKKNYCRAMLILRAIAVGLVVLLIILFGIMGHSILSEIERVTV